MERLVLCRGAHLLSRRQAGQEPTDFRFAHVGHGLQLMKAHEALDPVTVGLLGMATQIPGSGGKVYPIE